MNIKSIELDIAPHPGESIEEAIADLTQGTSITGAVVQERGPASGWPLVRLTGTEAELLELARKLGDDAEYTARKQLA